MRGLAQEYGFPLSDADRDLLTESLPGWPLFDDTVDALRRLAGHYRLGIISNIDEDLFALTQQKLGVTFDWVLTAEEAVSYKPSLRNFQLAEARAGVTRDRWCHAAQSLYHDIVPAKRHGVSAVWVNRRRGREGFGATLPAAAVPDLEVADLRELADRVEPR
jgi:2-haloacid dehalogenase